MFATLVRSAPGAGRGRSPRRPAARRPRLEALEDRCTPSSVGPPGYVLTDLGTLPGGWRSNAAAINDRGQVVGGSYTAAGDSHAFVYDHGAMTDLGTLGGPDSYAAAINDRGQVVGWATTRNTSDEAGDPFYDQTTHAFLYDQGTMTDLGALGGWASQAYDINDRGQVVGIIYCDCPAGGDRRAFLYSHGTMTDLGTLPGGTYSNATAINDRGQVVGTCFTAGGGQRAFLYSHGTMTDLNSLIPADSGFMVTAASDINERGQIAATGVDSAGNVHALLLTPAGPCFTATTTEFHRHHG